MSTLIFFTTIAFLTFALACATDWVIASSDPLKTLRKPVSRVSAKQRSYRRLAAKNWNTRKFKHQAEMRELPFIC
jgi:hypothetical protein